MAEIFKGAELIPPNNANVLDWLHYKADTIIYDFYREKEKQCKQRIKESTSKGKDQEYLNRLNYKCVDLYLKLSQNEFAFRDKYKKRYKFPYSPGEEDILYDVIFVFEEVLQDLLSINVVESRPQEKLVFCYKYLIDGWSSKDILYKLRKNKLDDLLISFVNEYSTESGIPNSVVLFYFYPIEEDMYKTSTSSTKLNSYFSIINIYEFLLSGEKSRYIKNIVDKRVNLIDKWCERTKERLIENISK
jgi:hypothetical protein